jgi:hypothetical protein
MGDGKRKPAAGQRWREAEARVMQLEAALWAIMRVTDGGDLRAEASRRAWEAITPARRIAREALGLPLMGGAAEAGSPRYSPRALAQIRAEGPHTDQERAAVAGERLDAERRGEHTHVWSPGRPEPGQRCELGDDCPIL